MKKDYLSKNEIINLMIRMQILALNFNPLLCDAKNEFYAYLEKLHSNGITISLESLLDILETIIAEYKQNDIEDSLTLI